MKNTLWMMIILMIISIIIYLLFLYIWTAVLVVFLGVIIITGITNIDNRPPKFGLLTRMNKKIWGKNIKPVILKEGYQWIFLRWIIYNTIEILADTRMRNLDPQDVLTPDNINVKIPISIEWNVATEESNLYIEIGEDKGVDGHISDILEARLREYSRSKKEGPMTWKEMIESSLKSIDYLAKALCGSHEDVSQFQNNGYDYFEKIHDEIPTPILLDWFQKNNPPNPTVREKWGDGKKWMIHGMMTSNVDGKFF